jgi:hypothetical protein
MDCLKIISFLPRLPPLKKDYPKLVLFTGCPNAEKGSNQCWVGMYFYRYPTERALRNLYTCKAWRGWACLDF